MKGYKVFNPDWTCRDVIYEVGETYKMDAKPICCSVGFHFCEKLADCFGYYEFNPENKIAEVEALGDIDKSDSDSKRATNKIKIVRELTWHECLDLVNSGSGNVGLRNSGNRNSGDMNSGNMNSGNWNSGNRNSGDMNSGNRNSGDRNSGDWNSTFGSSGCFNTEEPTIYMFNKPTNWTLRKWLCSDERDYLNEIPKNVVEWICPSEMTDDEKEKHPDYETTGGYLKVLGETENAQAWWDGAEQYKKDAIMALPNFDAEVFEKCTGIKV